MTDLRCSSLDSLVECGPSVIDDTGAIRINPDNDASDFGRLIHSMAGEFVETGKFDLNAEIARRGITDADAEEANFQMGQVVRVWHEHARFFEVPKTERSAAGNPIVMSIGSGGETFRLTGTLDVLSPKGNGAIFMDWKTGQDNGYSNQMYGYADIIWDLLGNPDDAVIVGIIAYTRLRKIVTVKYTADKLRDWKNSLVANVLRRRTYKPGGHCKFCPLWASCPARQAVVTSTFNSLMMPSLANADDPSARVLAKARDIFSCITVDNKNEPEVAEGLSQLRFRLKLAEQVIEELKEMERQAVERVGPIPLADGSALTLRPVDTKNIDALKALKILRAHLSDAEIAGCMKLSLPKLLSAKAAKFMRGEKKTAREQLAIELDRAGAVSVSTHHRLEEMDPEAKELPDES